MTEVFVLQHEYELDGQDETKLIGAYSSRAEAEAAIKRLSTQPGFSEYPGGFSIDPYPLDRDHWQEGFSTVVPILVALQDEGVDVWRPVQAERLTDGHYRIISENADPEDERWAFPTGSVVRCQARALEGEVQLVAVSLVERAG
jgi:hypothetical protein